MSAFVIHHANECQLHEIAPGHPEQPKRLSSIELALKDSELSSLLEWRHPSVIDPELLRLAHTEAYIESLIRLSPVEGSVQLDADTSMNAHSLDATNLASGALIDAAKLALENEASRQFCLVRPPGHHAESNKAMGFCLFNSIAVAAKFLAKQGARVAIVDFDVHHGNGTEEIVAGDPNISFFSSFQHPLYPYSDLAPLADNIYKYPLNADSDGHVMKAMAKDFLLPTLEKIRPDILLISAGFDAHQADPLANLNWLEEDYFWLSARLAEIADQYCGGKMISTLEGGYNLEHLASSAVQHLNAMAGRAFST